VAPAVPHVLFKREMEIEMEVEGERDGKREGKREGSRGIYIYIHRERAR